MSKKPLLSILIPVFNRAQLIGRAIESALNQTYSNIEVIVVDNASTDDTCLKVIISLLRRCLAFLKEMKAKSLLRTSKELGWDYEEVHTMTS